MADTKHTKGRWTCLHQPDRTAEIATVAWVGEWCVGVMTPGFPGGNYRDLDWGDTAADAHLIAAAPDMLAALESTAAYLQDLMQSLIGAGLDMRGGRTADQLMAVRAAIAKATGARDA